MTTEQEQSGGLWKDQKRSPGPWPQGNRKPLAMIAFVVALVLARLLIRDVFDRAALGAFVIAIGLGAFWSAWRLNARRVANERYQRGPGWWIGVLISKTSVPVARAIYMLMGLGICALGLTVLLK